MSVSQGIREGFTLSVVVRFGGQRTDVGHRGSRHPKGHHGQTFEGSLSGSKHADVADGASLVLERHG